MSYWLQGGLRPNKLILGIPTYGRGFTLEGPFNGQQRPPTKSGSNAGQFTGEAGFLAYHEVRHLQTYIKWENELKCWQPLVFMLVIVAEHQWQYKLPSNN